MTLSNAYPKISKVFLDSTRLRMDDRKSMLSVSYTPTIFFYKNPDGLSDAYALMNGIRKAGYDALIQEKLVSRDNRICFSLQVGKIPQRILDSIKDILADKERDTGKSNCAGMVENEWNATPKNSTMADKLGQVKTKLSFN